MTTFLAAQRLAQALAWADVFRFERTRPGAGRGPVLVALEQSRAGPPPGRQERLVLVRQPGELTRSVVAEAPEVIAERTVN